MSKVRVNCFSVSLDGYGAGPHQDRDHPLGVRGTELHDWFVPTRTFQSMYGRKGGSTGIDDDFARRGTENVGAWILGRNMFGPIRGAWPDEGWRGWWGDDPPYHAPVFVLTHYPRASLEMEGGTIFHFVTEGIGEGLRQAKQAAGSQDVRIGGGVDTVRQYLRAGLVDVLHIAMTPVLLGSGELLFAGLSMSELGYRVMEHVTSEAAMHVVIERAAAP